MEEVNLKNEKRFLADLKNIFSVTNTAKFLFENNIGVLIILNHIKAKDWPWKGKKLENTPTDMIPIIWGIALASDKENIKITFTIGINF
ncbi:unnamed protein product [marine sediment metagenome]|uniref:Uncharacterized protein n=1 Tax=marine sediment metagenome TaxID=412755 RepID=X1GR04_9ZZZZ